MSLDDTTEVDQIQDKIAAIALPKIDTCDKLRVIVNIPRSLKDFDVIRALVITKLSSYSKITPMIKIIEDEESDESSEEGDTIPDQTMFVNSTEDVRIKDFIKNTMDKDEVLAKQLPYNQMSKFGWVPETRLMKERVINLRKYFEVVELSLLENRQITKIACRRLAITEKGDFALIAWAQEAKRVARQTDTTHINIDKLVRVLPEIRSMTLETPAEFSAELKDKLAQCGIALVFLPHLQGSFLQGASFIDGKKIVIGLTARGKDADRFWFSLFHELGHIVLGHIGKTDEITEQDENEADLWAKDELIPKEEFEQFKKTQDYSSISVCDFANKIGIAPGIVVGRLQKERCITYNMLNELKEQYEIAM